MGDRQNRGLQHWDISKVYDKPEYVIVFDIDGVLAKYEYVKPEDRGPDKAPAIYSAMKPTFLTNWPIALQSAAMTRGTTGLEIVYLTARNEDVLKKTTVDWLKEHYLEGTLMFAKSLQEKVEIIDEYIPEMFGVHPSNMLAFDDRWEELLKSRVIWSTHNRYPSYKITPILKRGVDMYSSWIYQEYPEFAEMILRRYINLFSLRNDWMWRSTRYITPPRFPSPRRTLLRNRARRLTESHTIQADEPTPVPTNPTPFNAILRNR